MIPSKVKLSIGGIIGGIILVSLLFIPTDEFFGTNSDNSISPPPILVLNNYHDDFEVTSTSCTADSGFVEINFSINNKLDKNYLLELHLLQKGINNEDLSREGIVVKTIAGKTISETHQMPLELGLNICAIEVKRVVCTHLSAEDEYLDCKERYGDKLDDLTSSQLPTTTTKEPNEMETHENVGQFSLVYTKEGGIAGISESITIHSSEKTLIKRTAQGQTEILLNESQINSLLDTINDAELLWLGSVEYAPSEGWTDYFTYTLRVMSGDAESNITWTDTYDVPEDLVLISQQIEEIIVEVMEN